MKMLLKISPAQWKLSEPQHVKSLAPGRSQCNFKNISIFIIFLTDIFKSSYDNAFRWMPQNLTDASWYPAASVGH